MKKLLLIIFFAAFGKIAFCQDITVKAGTEATYQLTLGPDKKFTLTLVDTKTIAPGTDVENDMFKEKVDSNQVKVVLYAVPMDGKKRSSFIVKSGLKVVLKYSAKIKRAGHGKFIVTDVMPVPGRLSSNEMYPYEISEIMLSDFEEGSF
jgi:hypothetical protein